jgi:hypothetical protein
VDRYPTLNPNKVICFVDKQGLRSKKMPAIKSALLNIIAVLQIAGGVFLLGLFLFVEIPKTLKTPPEGPALINWGIAGLFMILAGLSIWAGYLLWKRRSLGFSLSAALQFLQIPYIYLSSVIYTFHASLVAFIVHYASADEMIDFTFQYGGAGEFFLGTGLTDTPTIGINLVAVIFLVLILNMQRLVKND